MEPSRINGIQIVHMIRLIIRRLPWWTLGLSVVPSVWCLSPFGLWEVGGWGRGLDFAWEVTQNGNWEPPYSPLLYSDTIIWNWLILGKPKYSIFKAVGWLPLDYARNLGTCQSGHHRFQWGQVPIFPRLLWSQQIPNPNTCSIIQHQSSNHYYCKVSPNPK